MNLVAQQLHGEAKTIEEATTGTNKIPWAMAIGKSLYNPKQAKLATSHITILLYVNCTQVSCEI